VGEAYRRQGYVVEETRAGADGGVDLVLHRGDEKTLVQCKRWKTREVGVAIVRELFGVVTAEGASRGILVTCGRFTREARTFAEGKPLQLIDGPTLWKLVEGVRKGAKAPQASPVQVAAASPSARKPPTTTETPICPDCGSPMVLRTARRGPKAGSQFYGCSKYPNSPLQKSLTQVL
jgi:restriction system protein